MFQFYFTCESRSIFQRVTKSQDNWQYPTVAPLYSRSFKVIDLCCNRKPIYDYILLINCHLSSISYHFRDIASRSRKPPQPTFILQTEGTTFKFCHQTWHGKELRHCAIFCENCMILTSAVLSQYTCVTDE